MNKSNSQITRKKPGVKIVLVFAFIFVVFNLIMLYRSKYVYESDTIVLKAVEPPLLHHTPLEKVISCYYLKGDNSIPSAEDIVRSNKSIFFLESSCRGDLDTRKLCAVESTARSNPQWNVYVLFISPVPLNSQNLRIKELSSMKNVRAVRVNITEYVKGTAVEALMSSGSFAKSKWPVIHVSDVLRILTLYKFGGVYLDLDVVITKPFDSLPANFGARESNYSISTGILRLSNDELGKTISGRVVEYTAHNFRGNSWNNNGPRALEKIVKEFCNISNIENITAATCKGFEVFGPKDFYPIYYPNYMEYFKTGDLKYKDAYMYHVWNGLSEQTKIEKDSPYANLAKEYCPNTYNNHQDHFGGDSSQKLN